MTKNYQKIFYCNIASKNDVIYKLTSFVTQGNNAFNVKQPSLIAQTMEKLFVLQKKVFGRIYL